MVQRLAGFLAGATADGNSHGSPVARIREVSGSLSYLEEVSKSLSEGATRVEVEVVGTCVYYYLAGPGHDARSRIRITFVFSSEALFSLGAAGSSAVLDRTSGMEHCLECGGVSGL